MRVGFAQQAGETPTGAATPKLPGSLAVDPYLDSWIRLEPNDAVTVFTGKAELGQGIKTALLQVAAEELGLPVERLTIVTADTGRTPNEGYTAGSHSMQDSGAAIRNAAAQMRELLIDRGRAPAEPANGRAQSRERGRDRTRWAQSRLWGARR